MAISMGAALLGSAVIGGVGSAISGSKSRKAIRRSEAAQTAANDRTLALQKEARDQNVAMQQPFYQTGLAANNRVNALLGLGGQGSQGGELQAANQGFDDWRNNTGYQFRFNEGIRAIDAGAPVRNSGATLKARMAYGQGLASDEYGRYFGALQDQQRVGVGAANALSGVQTNYANNATAIAQNQGQNAANSAIARANNTNAMIGGITSSFGNAAGMYAGLGGFGGPNYNASINRMFSSNPGIF